MPWLEPDSEVHNCPIPDFTRGWHFKNGWLRRKPLPLGSRWQCPWCRQIWVIKGTTMGGLLWAHWENKPPANAPRGKGGIATRRTS